MTLAPRTTLAIAGECMVTRPFSHSAEPGFEEVVSRLRAADVTYAHVETNFGNYCEVRSPARGGSLGSYFLTDPRAAHDLRWAGIDLVSLANNHSLDFGAEGLLATIAHCEQAGLAHAGTGRDLEEAREPSYLETRNGRVALVSVSSGNQAHEWASLPKATMAGRPGVNPLRATMEWSVDAEAAEQIKSIWGRLGVLQERAGGRSEVLEDGVFKLPMPSDPWGANYFRASDHFGITSQANKFDLAGNLRSVAEAVAMADLVLVAHHFSVSEGTRGDRPPAFVRDFAHACIDEGADIYVGHGWHKTLGIEIYKGKPIIYGIGNFFAQSEFVRRVAFDAYESWGHDIEQLPALTPAAHPLHPGVTASSGTWWNSAVLEIELADRHLAGIRLNPVELGREVSPGAPLRRQVGAGEHPLTDGRPFAATGTDAERVLERYQRLSADFGTTVVIENGIGYIK